MDGSNSQGMNDAINARHAEIVVLFKLLFRELAPQLQGYKIVLFGSRAAGRALARSDFDLGVLGAKPMPFNPLAVVQNFEDRSRYRPLRQGPNLSIAGSNDTDIPNNWLPVGSRAQGESLYLVLYSPRQ